MKNVLIAGASRGLGLAFVEIYAEKGDNVIAASRSGVNDSLKALMAKYKHLIHVVKMDLSNSKSVSDAAEEVKTIFSSLDIIINNGGMHAPDGRESLENINVDNSLEVYNVNTLGPLRVTQAFLSLIEKGETKCIVNISSDSGSISNCKLDRQFDYGMSKAALNMQSKTIQNYLKVRGIKVLSIHPGWMRTDMGRPTATFAPEQSAVMIANLIEKFCKELDGPVYIDYNGKELTY